MCFFNYLSFDLLMMFFFSLRTSHLTRYFFNSSRSTTSSNERSARTTPTTMSSTSTHPAPSDLQTQLHDPRSLLADHNEKVRALEGVISEHDAIRREVRLLRQLVKKMSGDRGSELVGVGAASDNESLSIVELRNRVGQLRNTLLSDDYIPHRSWRFWRRDT